MTGRFRYSARAGGSTAMAGRHPWCAQFEHELARDEPGIGTGFMQQGGDIDDRRSTTQNHYIVASEPREVHMLGAVRDELSRNTLD